MPALFRIRREFDRLWDEENKLLPVQITSAIELDEPRVEQIGDRIGEQTGRKVELVASGRPRRPRRPRRARRQHVLDASIRNRLEHLRKQVARA